MGDPTVASADLGTRLVEAATVAVLEVVEDLRALPEDAPEP
jgi:creatinine amidohydrolase/Fe(II)-dependent formamide hydrolase-like protein